MPLRPKSEGGNLTRLVEKQLRNWEIAQTQNRQAPIGETDTVRHFLTVANVAGAGGHDLVTKLGDKLNWPTFHREILSEMAGDDEVRMQLYKSMDERDLGWVENTFRSLMQREFQKNDYFPRLTETILFLARRGPAIFVGRCADLILPQNKGLRIKVIASIDFCVNNFAQANNVPVDQARLEVERIEAERRAFVKNRFNVDAYEPTRFDLLINVERFTMDHAVDLVMHAMRSRGII